MVDPADGVDAIDDATLRAVHRLEVAAEWIERAFGALLDAHHAAGHGQEMLLEAADAARRGGPRRAGRAGALATPACRDAADGRWTYQVVDEFRGHLLDPARRVEERVRDELAGGVRHRYEARMKRDTPGATSTTEVRLPGGLAPAAGKGAPAAMRSFARARSRGRARGSGRPPARPSRPYQAVKPSAPASTRTSSQPSPHARCFSVRRPIVDQNPGTASQRASSPAIDAARHLALGEGLAPVLHAQAPAGGGVVGQGDVARAAHAVGRRAHRGVDGHRAVLHRAGPRPRPAPPADARRCRGPRGRTAPRRRPRGPRAARRPRPGSPTRRRRSGRRRRPPPATPGSAAPTSLAQPLRLGRGLGRDHRHPGAAHRQRRGRLAAHEARADHRDAHPGPDGGADRGRVARACGSRGRRGGRRRRAAAAPAPSRCRARTRRTPASAPSSRSTSRSPGRSAATGVAVRSSTSCRRNQASSSIGSSSAGSARAGTPW